MFRPTHIDKKRIKLIAKTMATQPPGTKSCVMVDRGGEYEGKAEWYLARFKEKYPELNAEYIGVFTPEVDTIRVTTPVLPPHTQN